MKRFEFYFTLLAFFIFLPNSKADIEFIYAIKEQIFEQGGNFQPNTPTRWNFGAGASGDSSLTAVSITPLGSENPIQVIEDDGSFELEGEGYLSQATMDAVYPNGSVSFNITDNGASQTLGPFSIAGDAYPIIPYLTNTLALQDSDHSQDFEITWNAFAGADEGDRIILQVWEIDGGEDEELIFEFLDPTATSFVIPGGTLVTDKFYDIDLIFVNETDGLESPETIVGYLSTTTYYLSTSTSDTNIFFYKWRSREQTATDTLASPLYRPITSVTGNTRTVTYAHIDTPADENAHTLNNIGPNQFRLLTDFGSKEILDAVYPDGHYRFGLIEDGDFIDYGPLTLEGDTYPENPLFQNFSELQLFDAGQSQTISWNAAPTGVDLIQVLVLDDSGTQIWIENLPSNTTSTQLPANTLAFENNYRLAVRFWSPFATITGPPTTVGYLSSTIMDIETSAEVREPGVSFIYTVKERSHFQEDNSTSVNPYLWSFGAGVNGGYNVTGGSLNYPGGSENFSGSDGEYNTSDHRFASQEELDTNFPSGEYSLNVTVDGSTQALGPFSLSGGVFPTPPHITNVVEFQSHDLSQDFTIQWDVFSESDVDDRIAIEVNNFTTGQELIFEFLDPTATSYEIPGGTLMPGNQYEIDILFVNETDGLESPDTIIGYLSRTKFHISTTSSDTEITLYKMQRNLQSGADSLLLDGYRALTTVTGISTPVTYAEVKNQQGNNPLQFISTNTYLLGTPFGTKESLDNSYPFGGYQIGVIENEDFVDYGPYYLGPDAYPQSPLFQNFESLQSFDATFERTITWNPATNGVTLISLQIRDDSNEQVWATELDPSTTSAVIPSGTLSQFENYRLFLQFWARQTGSENPDASIGYLATTYMPIQTFPDSIEYSAWLLQFFDENELQNPNISGETADPDGDSLSNEFEFLAKLDPSDPNSKLYFSFPDDSSDIMRISPINPGVNWEFRTSSDLANWIPAEVQFYELRGIEIQIDLQSLLPKTFFQVAVNPAEP